MTSNSNRFGEQLAVSAWLPALLKFSTFVPLTLTYLPKVLLTVGAMAVCLAVHGIPESLACSCVEATFDQNIEHADAIFIGTAGSSDVDSTTRYWDFDNVVFVKGGSQAAMPPTATPIAGSACGYGFEAGTEYVVFATIREREMSTSLCSGNMEASELSAPQIQTLSELQTSGLNDGAGAGNEDDPAPACAESEIKLGQCIRSELLAVLLLAAVGAAGLAVMTRLRSNSDRRTVATA